MSTHSISLDREHEERSCSDQASVAVHGHDSCDKVLGSLPDAPDQFHILPHTPPDRVQILHSLDRICASAAFQGSMRCQQFLRFIVNQSLEGHADELKERTIATEVFGRGTDFDSGEDSLVRVKARDLRRRLDSFYETDTELTCRIEIPIGSYAPRFIAIERPFPAEPEPFIPAISTEAVQPIPVQRRMSRRKLIWSAAALLGGVALGTEAIWEKLHAPSSSLDQLWWPVFRSGAPLVIFIPVLKDRATQEITDRIGIGPAQALRKAIDFLDLRHYPYHLRFGSDMSFAVLKEQPSLLLGGFSSTWTALMTKGLRYTMRWNEENQNRAIFDSATGKTWVSVNPTKQGFADRDYGLLTRLFDRETGQISMIAGGLTTFGTEAAAEILFSSQDFEPALKDASADWEKKNFQMVAETDIIGTTASHPRIVGVHFW